MRFHLLTDAPYRECESEVKAAPGASGGYLRNFKNRGAAHTASDFQVV